LIIASKKSSSPSLGFDGLVFLGGVVVGAGVFVFAGVTGCCGCTVPDRLGDGLGASLSEKL
jgi:hypothetical protein